jgi:ribosomal-protein-alanine N-acetyltransferase
MIINKIKIIDDIFAEYINTDLIDLQNYLSWLSNHESNPFILATSEKWNSKKLKSFIQAQNDSKDTALIGIFDQSTRRHVGNIKYENVYLGSLTCSFGILIGESDYRGRGIGAAVISETMKHFSVQFNISEFSLGVDKDNGRAIKTYSNLGFKVTEHSENNESIRMSFKCHESKG